MMSNETSKLMEATLTFKVSKELKVAFKQACKAKGLVPAAVLRKMMGEYVRAELAYGDADEPLAAGQCRWVRLSKDDAFIPATIHQDWFCKDRLVYLICGYEADDYVEDCYEWGPVINAPELNK